MAPVADDLQYARDMLGRLAFAAVVLIAGGIAGCGPDADGTSGSGSSSSGSSEMSGSTIHYDDGLTKAIKQLSRGGEPRKLAAIIDFEWDAVYVYSEGAAPERVEQDVGSDVLDGERYYDAGNLLVFVRNGEVVAAHSVLPDLLAWDGDNRFGAKATLVPDGGLVHIR